jgi:hypothetical protein
MREIDMDALKEAFKNPPVSHRPAPLWVWNDLMSKKQIEFQLKELSSHGFGGAFVHPRPGLITEYLSEEWFELWGYALDVAKRLNLKLYIYDENSYPSGFAGGLVPSELPDCLASGMSYYIISNVNELPCKTIIKVYTCIETHGTICIEKDITSTKACDWEKEGNCFFVVTRERPAPSDWLAGFAFVDLMRPEVTSKFLETTHEQYYSRFGNDFGNAVPALFTDEPYISNGGVCDAPNSALPFSYWLAGEFQKQHGYSLLDNIPCIFKNVGGSFVFPPEKVRYDYYTTIHTLWTKNSIEPIGRWCADHNIAWTGHYLEHQWPFAYSQNTSPSLQAHYEYHQWPAIDMLLSNYLRNTETHSLTLTIQEVRSAANQFGKERTLCELYGAGGWDSTFEDYKRMGDWVLVNGINFINQHLVYATLTGARKRDHPQSFDWRQPWWNEYTQINYYLSRASLLLSSGKMQQRILVINPSTTGYLVPYQEERGNLFSFAGTDAIENPDMWLHLEVVQSLCDNQWDFDFGDEYTIQRHACIVDKRFVLGKQQYDVLIISGDTKNLKESSIKHLRQFAKVGGRIVAVSKPGNFMDGLRKPEIWDELAGLWIAVDDISGLQTLLHTLLPNRIQSSEPWVQGVTHMRRVLDDGREIYFFVNHHFGNFTTQLTLAGKSVSQWNLYTGETEAMDFETYGDHVTFTLSLVHNQSVMLIVNDGSSKKTASEPIMTTPVALSLTSVYADNLNMFPIGYCDLTLNGKTYDNISIFKGCDKIFNERGFEGNPWDNKVQFRNNLMNRNTFGLDSGFRADYHFTVEKGFQPQMIQAVAEHPSMCHLTINGHSVRWLPNEYCWDEHFGVADIAPYIVDGKNTLTMTVDTFDVRMELESVYLRGEFSVAATDDQWTIMPSKKLQIGKWKDQGLPFYSGAVFYRFTTNLNIAPKMAMLAVTNYLAAAMSVTVNGQYFGLLCADGIRPANIAPLLKKGENEITIRISSNFKNLMGPHFMESPIRGSAWPGMWKEAPDFFGPKASSYDLLLMGLFEAPTLMIN